MILDNELIDFIKTKLIKTANLLGIESVIIEPDKIRGLDEKKTAVILHNHSLPVKFQAMAISRLSLLQSRLTLTDDTVSVNVTEDERNPGIISRLDIKAKKYKVDFRTANPTTVKAPKALKSEVALCSFTLTDNDVKLINNASNSMPQRTETGTISLMIDPKTSTIKAVLTDTTGDDFEMELDSKLVNNTLEKPLLINYPLKQFITVIKNNNKQFDLLENNNMIRTYINDITIILLPTV